MNTTDQNELFVDSCILFISYICIYLPQENAPKTTWKSLVLMWPNVQRSALYEYFPKTLNVLRLCFRNWHIDEPSCGYEVCVVMYHQPSAKAEHGGLYMFQWNDDNCETKNNFICKYTGGTAENKLSAVSLWIFLNFCISIFFTEKPMSSTLSPNSSQKGKVQYMTHWYWTFMLL